MRKILGEGLLRIVGRREFQTLGTVVLKPLAPKEVQTKSIMRRAGGDHGQFIHCGLCGRQSIGNQLLSRTTGLTLNSVTS